MIHYGLWSEGGGFVSAAAVAFTGDVAEAALALPLVVAGGVELLECGEVVVGVGFVGVDLCDGGIGCEAFGAHAKAVGICGELGVSVALGGGAGPWGLQRGPGVVDRVGLKVEVFDAALGEHVDAAAYEWADVFLRMGGGCCRRSGL